MKTYSFLLSLLLVIGCTPLLENMEQPEALHEKRYAQIADMI